MISCIVPVLSCLTLVSAAKTSGIGIHDQDWHHYNYFMAGPVFGQSILGSEDVRRGQEYMVGRAFYSRQLSETNIPGFFVTELYYNNTLGGGLYAFPKDDLHTYGITTVMRFHPTWIPHHKLFLDAGWGLSFGDRTTDDLDSTINSTPILGIGTTWDVGSYRAVATMRYQHFSNAGTKLPNHGSNQVQFLFGIEF